MTESSPALDEPGLAVAPEPDISAHLASADDATSREAAGKWHTTQMRSSCTSRCGQLA